MPVFTGVDYQLEGKSKVKAYDGCQELACEVKVALLYFPLISPTAQFLHSQTSPIE